MEAWGQLSKVLNHQYTVQPSSLTLQITDTLPKTLKFKTSSAICIKTTKTNLFYIEKSLLITFCWIPFRWADLSNSVSSCLVQHLKGNNCR